MPQFKKMTIKDLNRIESLLTRTNNLPDILHLRASEMGYTFTQDDKELLKKTYIDLDDILKEVATFINVKFPGRQDYIQAWNKIDFDTKIGGLKVHTTDREHMKREWKNGMFDLVSLLKTLKHEIELRIEENNTEKKQPKVLTNNFNGNVVYTQGNLSGNVNQSSNNFSNNSITNNTTANPTNESKTNSIILKFWKLISENKLISSLLLALILWAIKEIFGINFKV